MDLTVEKKMCNYKSDQYNPQADEEYTSSFSDYCLTIKNEQYDKYSLLKHIYEFLKHQEETQQLPEKQDVQENVKNEESALEQLPPPDEKIYKKIQFIVKQFQILYAAHETESKLHTYIKEILKKVPAEYLGIAFEKKDILFQEEPANLQYTIGRLSNLLEQIQLLL